MKGTSYPKQITAHYHKHDITGRIIHGRVNDNIDKSICFSQQVIVNSFDEEEKFYQSLPEYCTIEVIQK